MSLRSRQITRHKSKRGGKETGNSFDFFGAAMLQLVEILTSGDVAYWEFWISEF